MYGTFAWRGLRDPAWVYSSNALRHYTPPMPCFGYELA